jgi:hypothetical protein
MTSLVPTAYFNVAASVCSDVRYTLRGLKNAPGYAFTIILTLAFGLGAVTTMLAVVDCVLLRPVALPHPEQAGHARPRERARPYLWHSQLLPD